MQSRSRKAQIALFLIVAGVVFLAAALVMVRPKPIPVAQLPLYSPSVISETATYCLKEVSEAVIRIVALQGGYWKPPQPSADAVYFTTPYFLKNQKVAVPPVSILERSAAEGVDELLPSCIIKTNHSIQYFGLPHSLVTITEKAVAVQTTFPLVLRSQGRTMSQEQFAVTTLLPLLEALTTSNEILKLQTKEGSLIPVSEIMLLLDKKDGLFFPMYIDSNHYVYAFYIKKGTVVLPFAFGVEIPEVKTGEA